MDLTGNQTRLSQALPAIDQPPATPAQLAKATALGYSTITRLLRELAEAGLAVKDGTGWRATGAAPGAGGAEAVDAAEVTGADHDHVACTDITAAPHTADAPATPPADGRQAARPDNRPAGGASHDEPGGTDPQTDTTADAASQRLRKGELPKQVLALLQARPGEALGPHQLYKLLGARSAGAVGNACDRLVADGLATLANEKPRRYHATPTT